MAVPSKEEVFRKFVFDATNNESLTDMVCRLNEATCDKVVVPGSPELDDDTLFVTNLYEICPHMGLIEDICHIRDLIYGDGSRTLDVDPSYQDAEVSDEPRPKCDSICGVIAIRDEGPSVYDSLREMREWEHIRKFDPMKEQAIIRYNNLPELDKLAITPVEPSPYYNRF